MARQVGGWLPSLTFTLDRVNTVIEIHDSAVARIDEQQNDIVVDFLAAYLHKSEGRPGYDPGTGWRQEARLVFGDASVCGDFPDLPCVVMDGGLIVGGEQHDNEIPVPLASAAVAELRLIFDAVHAVTVTGRGVRLQLCGEPRYVEDFKP